MSRGTWLHGVVTDAPPRRDRPAGAALKASATEVGVFCGATALIVLHVLLDAFVLVEPGASRADHLLAGLVPIAVAAVAIAFYRSMWAGLRATVAFVFGVLALVRAGLAVSDLSDGDPTRDDWSALVLVPAGLVLCGLAVWLLWRSRKPGRWRWARRAALVVVAVLAAYWVLFPAAFGIVATEKPRTSVEPADLGRPYEQVALRTSDGLSLAGWYVPSRNGAAVIAFPGRSGPVEHARMLARHGYGVLLLDMRGQGESRGRPERVRLAVRQGPGGGDRVSRAAPRRRQRAHRRPGLVGRR